ncbi:MAG: hypothetical protein ACRC46_00500 [Thermoguttaceae bacterium]
MTRLMMVCVVFLVGVASAIAQLPNRHGQVWREYVFPPDVVAQNKACGGGNWPGAEIINIVKRETGEKAWTGGEMMGLIGCDANKLYVYHTPAIHAHVSDVVNRFTRPELREVCFSAEVRFVTREKNAKPLGVQQQLTPYLRPLRAVHDGKPAYQTCGVTAFWVAKENVAAFKEALQTQLNMVLASPTDNLLQAPKVVTLNGGRAFVNDTTRHKFVTSVIPVVGDTGTTYQSDISVVDAGMTLELFSLLTSDARSVSTDVSLLMTCIDKVDTYSFSDGRMVGLDEAPSDVAVNIQVPHVEKIELAETGLVWPSDGMLVVFLTGIERTQEREVRQEYGTPVLNKIPYINRLFKNTAIEIGRETVLVTGILTVNVIP